MEMSGEYNIAAPRQAVWDALNDPEMLKACIPGCDTLEKTSDTEMTATVTAKVGPVKAKFAGAVTLSEIDAPNSYRISGEGKGGAAGFAKGGAHVALSDAEGGGTLLQYTVEATVGGKLAQIGSRLIDATAKKMAGQFFGTLAESIAVEPSEEDAPSAAASAPAETKDPFGRRWKGYSPMTWVSGGIFVVLSLVMAFKYFTR